MISNHWACINTHKEKKQKIYETQQCVNTNHKKKEIKKRKKINKTKKADRADTANRNKNSVPF